MRGQLDLWVEWVLPQEEDRLYYTVTHTESRENSLEDCEQFSGFLRECHISVIVLGLPQAKIPPVAKGLDPNRY